jgi:phosphoribosyl-AMP cyclohydrolase
LVGYTNELAMRKRPSRERMLILWSTSRNVLWEKGKTSARPSTVGGACELRSRISLLYIVRPKRGAICHTKNRKGEPRNCYYRRVDMNTLKLTNLDP